jgi:membrane-associated phospholipid phosphatase
MTPLSHSRLLIGFLWTCITVQALFAALPGIDLAVARLFARGAEGFVWAGGPMDSLNLLVRRLGEGAVLALLLAFLYGAVSGRLSPAILRALAFPILTVGLASGLIVNLILKAEIGRARPAHLAEFGGSASFSPPWQIVTECARNCSFTSGEVAMAAALAVTLPVLVWPQLGSPRLRRRVVAGAAAYVALVALLRIGLGRHFLSDAVFSTLIAAGVALALYPVLRIGHARAELARRLPLTLLADRAMAWLKRMGLRR